MKNRGGTIVALMFFGGLFALFGDASKKGVSIPNEIEAGAKIVVGGVVATSLLLLLSHAGEGGREAAVGLALVTFLTTTLVYGGPAWNALTGYFGSQPTGMTGTTGATASTAQSAQAQNAPVIDAAAVTGAVF